MAIISTPPQLGMKSSFAMLVDDYFRNDPVNGRMYIPEMNRFEQYVRRLHDEEAGRNLPSETVPCSHRWLVNEPAIVAIVRIRHGLGTPYLRDEAGHIGYDVPPAWRGKGYGTAALQAGLAEAQRLKLDKVLITADTENVASWKTIERCGGVLESELVSKHYGKLFRRYWIAW